VFTRKCTERAGDIEESLDGIDVDEFRLGSASALVVKNYPLDPQNLTSSYFNQLDNAVADFCAEPSELPRVINQVFEETYREVFETEPVDEFSGGLGKRE
jgi:hypothetical protein